MSIGGGMESTVRCPFTDKLIEVCCPQLSHKSSTNVFDVEPAKLGRGSSGVVRTCKVKTDGAAFALKKVSLGIGAAGPTRADMLREAILWKELNHPNIVGYYLSWEETNSDCSEDEYGDEDSRDKHTHTGDEHSGDKHTHTGDDHKSSQRPCFFMLLELSESSLAQKLEEVVLQKHECWKIFQQIMDALRYIHSQGILHGDLTSKNVFLKDKKVKIGEFGSARRLANRYNGGAPCRLLHKAFDVQHHDNEGNAFKPKDEVLTDRFDIYCVGVILVEMLAGKMLESDKDTALTRIVKNKGFPHKWDREWKALLNKLLHRNYLSRPSANDVYESIKPIISGLKRKRKSND